MAGGESSRFAVASSDLSSRNFALRDAESAPWHAKQFSERTGRTSRLYSIAAGLAAADENSTTHVNRRTQQKVALTVMMTLGLIFTTSGIQRTLQFRNFFGYRLFTASDCDCPAQIFERRDYPRARATRRRAAIRST